MNSIAARPFSAVQTRINNASAGNRTACTCTRRAWTTLPTYVREIGVDVSEKEGGNADVRDVGVDGPRIYSIEKRTMTTRYTPFLPRFVETVLPGIRLFRRR